MRILALLPLALGNRIPILEILNDDADDFHIDKEISDQDITRQRRATRCSKEFTNAFLSTKMDRCERYQLDHLECSKWAGTELQGQCGGNFNCVVSKREGDWAGRGLYWGNSSK